MWYMTGDDEVISIDAAARMLTPAAVPMVPLNSFGTCRSVCHRGRASTTTTSSLPSSMRACGAISAPLPYCRALARATMSARLCCRWPSATIVCSCGS